ncbi:MAG: biotin/lipoyl-binding protein, partial [Verrucomicrobia bacterium]|nr:biotin/lipoyl-binding protein [Verrucomicrobiota bacterium]
MKKYVFSALRWLVVLAFLLGLAWVGLLYLKKQDEAEVPQFTSAKIARGDVVQAVTATGTLNPVVNVQVGSQISGNIQKLAADFNSQVKENQVIAQLDSATYRANVLQCEGDLASSKAALELARISARRADELIKNKLIPQADVDNALATLHQAEATIKIKEANLERA